MHNTKDEICPRIYVKDIRRRVVADWIFIIAIVNNKPPVSLPTSKVAEYIMAEKNQLSCLFTVELLLG